MRTDGATFVMPLLNWMDEMIAQYGLEMFAVAVHLAPFVMIWVLAGGFWRRTPRLPKAPPVLPPLEVSNPHRQTTAGTAGTDRRGRRLSDEDAFAA